MNFLSNINMGFKLVTVIAIFLVVGEMAWAGWTLTRPLPQKAVSEPVSESAVPSKLEEKTILSLVTPKSGIKVGEKFTVSINVFSVKRTDGIDVVINYDPRILSVVKNSPQGQTVSTGKIYTDYPLNIVDEQLGRIAVSGINSSIDGVIPKGEFGSVVFVPKRPGPTKISFEFTPSNTTDSNVIENKTAKDILDGVQNLDINITQ